MFQEKSCEYCGNIAQHACKGCNIASYCDKSHQKEDWKRHKAFCRSVKLENNDECGRYLTASRNLKPGELIFTEDPIALGPRAISSLVCLGCHSMITEDNFQVCSTCSWPMCSTNCANGTSHVQECQVLKKDVKKCGVPFEHGETPRYDIILILRCLLLRDSNVSAWRKLQNMESHLQKRKEETEPYHMAAVRYFTEVCEVNLNTDVIHHVRGAIITNCYETKSTSGESLRGVYPILGLVNHSCIPNISLRADRVGKMYIRAATAIQQGEPLAIAYTDTTTPIWERQSVSQNLHFFSCNCSRCQSPSELGSFFSSPRCPSCGTIALLMAKNINNFYCSQCCHEDTTENIMDHANSTASALIFFQEDIKNKPLGSIRKGLMNIENTFHRKHYLWMQMAQMIVKVLKDQYDIDSLRLKRDLWNGILNIYSITDPGMSRRRGMTLLELGMMEYILHEKEAAMDLISLPTDSLKAKVQILKRLSEAEQILTFEPPNSHELKWLERARMFIKENFQSLK